MNLQLLFSFLKRGETRYDKTRREDDIRSDELLLIPEGKLGRYSSESQRWESFGEQSQ